MGLSPWLRLVTRAMMTTRTLISCTPIPALIRSHREDVAQTQRGFRLYGSLDYQFMLLFQVLFTIGAHGAHPF